MSSHITTRKKQAGFSLIELLLVVMIIGVIAAIGTPVLKDARLTAQRSAALSSLRRVHGAQTSYRLSYGRYATMGELNAYQNGGLGETLDERAISRSGYKYEILDPMPTQSNVEGGFFITATGVTNSGGRQMFILSANGSIQQISPVVKDIVSFN